MMSGSDVIGVIVRLAGLGFIQTGLFDLYYVVVKIVGIQTQSKLPLSWDVRGFLLYFVWGIILIVGANSIARLVYWGETQE
jgi:hypothetical protein